jgi:hypothetical protein
VFRKFWPEIELNSTLFQDGKNDGHKQNFVTPGLVMGRFRLCAEQVPFKIACYITTSNVIEDSSMKLNPLSQP